jgi:hypothetical protein
LNLEFLGDALDHWKGSIFESLLQASLVRDFAVDPMASDQEVWQLGDFTLLARLLRVDRSRLIPHQVGLADRKRYFAEIAHTGDLFVDPDTGVATGKVKKPKCYITPGEVATLLEVPERLLLVYQHVQRQEVSERVDAVSHKLEEAVPELNWCSYESGTVAMLFLARSKQRTSAVAAHFTSVLGRHAEGRIRGSGNGA